MLILTNNFWMKSFPHFLRCQYLSLLLLFLYNNFLNICYTAKRGLYLDRRLYLTKSYCADGIPQPKWVVLSETWDVRSPRVLLCNIDNSYMFRSTDSGTRWETNKRQSITGEVKKGYKERINAILHSPLLATRVPAVSPDFGREKHG